MSLGLWISLPPPWLPVALNTQGIYTVHFQSLWECAVTPWGWGVGGRNKFGSRIYLKACYGVHFSDPSLVFRSSRVSLLRLFLRNGTVKTNMYKLCCTWVSNSIGYKCGKISGIFHLSSFLLFIFVLCSARCSWSGWFTSDRLHFSGFCTHFDLHFNSD